MGHIHPNILPDKKKHLQTHQIIHQNTTIPAKLQNHGKKKTEFESLPSPFSQKIAVDPSNPIPILTRRASMVCWIIFSDVLSKALVASSRKRNDAFFNLR
jgi:hypothetical protein